MDETRGGLLDRGVELQAVRRRLDEARAGRGSLIVIEGPGGIGKTRLLNTLRELAGGAGVRCWHARGGVLETDYAFGVVRRLLSGSARAPVKDEPPAGMELAGILDAVDASGAVEAATVAVLEGLTTVVLSAAEAGPLVISVDDAHWADAETLRWLAYLAERLRESPILLAVATRPRERGAEHGSLDVLSLDPSATVLRPSPLSDESIGAILADRAAAPPAPEFVAACAHATGGNPFLVAELLRTLVDERLQPTLENAARVSGFAPVGVSRAVLARIARLPRAAREVAASLAVLGGQAEFSRLASLSDRRVDELVEAIDALVAAEVLSPSEEIEFLHPLIRGAIYDDLSLAERDHGHARAAEVLSRAVPVDHEEVAAHLMAARPRGDQEAVHALAAAADLALARSAPASAARYLRRALNEPPAEEETIALLIALGEADRRRGDPESAATVLGEAHRRSVDPVQRAEIAHRRSQPLSALGQSATAVSDLLEAVTALPEDQVEVGLRVESALDVLAHLDAAAGQRLAERTPRFTSVMLAPEDSGTRMALASRSHEAMNSGTADEAARLALLALADGELLSREGTGSFHFYSTAIVLLYCDHLDDAERVYEEAIVLAQRRKQSDALPRGFLAGVHLRRGDLAQAQRQAQLGLPPLPADGTGVRALFAGAFLIDALVDRGATDEAARVVADLGVGGDLPRALVTNVMQNARARLRSARGDHAGALEDHRECGRRAAAWEMHTPAVANWHAAAGTELAALGREREAADEVREGVRIARGFGSERALGVALLAQGRVTNDLDRLQEAVDVLERSPARLERARALIALGAAARRNGQRVRGREALRAGLRLARGCGAEPLAAEALAELEVTGARARKLLRTGADALTASERRVALAAAGGSTNQEIAAALVISIRTVETHLAHVYQKLDITSRRQLAGVLGSEGAEAGIGA